MNTLCIFGDSWACGAWSTIEEGTLSYSDNYFQKQLGRKYFIESFADGGRSNALSLINLTSFLQKYSTEDLNKFKFLIVQTDPIRDFYHTEFNRLPSDFYNIFKKGNFKEFVEIQIELFYYQLNVLATRYNIKFNIIGGCSDVHHSIVKYTNLNVLCFSWFELIDKNHKHGVFSTTTNIGQIIKINSHDDGEIVDQIYRKSIIIDREQGNYFGYNGDEHPSRKGQDLMIHLIIDKL
jgi:hypothetical protein